jgi:hypothetical protein
VKASEIYPLSLRSVCSSDVYRHESGRYRSLSFILVFENRILRRIFGPKRDENGEWRKLHSEEFNNLYCLPNIVRAIKYRRLRWAGHMARMEEGRTAFKILTGTPKGNRDL